jgi:PAS domain S-box-containing protein
MSAEGRSLIVNKLTWISALASGTALLLACLALMAYDVIAFRTTTVRNVAIQAQLIASVSTLVFNDRPTAERTLNALSAAPHIEGAGLYQPDGRLFASYVRDQDVSPLVVPGRSSDMTPRYTFDDWRLHVVHPVLLDGVPMGLVYIRSDLQELTSRLLQYVLLVGVVLMVSMTASLLVSRVARESIARPIVELAAVATRVSREQDYSVRATSIGQGELGALISAFNDMLAQIQKGDRSLHESYDLLREATARATDLAAIVDASDDAIIGASVTGIIRTWNAAAARLYGYPADEAIGQSVRLIVPPEFQDEMDGILAAGAAGESVTHLQTVRVTKSGRLVDVALTISPIRDRSGAVIGVSTVARDVTQERQIEERFRLAVESSPSGVLLVDGSGRIVLTNREVERMFGYEPQELVGQPVDMLLKDPRKVPRIDLREDLLAGAQNRRLGQGRDIHGRRKDGSAFPAEIGINPLTTREGPLTLIVIADISERVAMLALLEEQTTELRRSNDELMQFAYVASHDLQEPLRMVASYTELLASRYRGHLDERGDKYVRYITEGATRMQRLVRDLLAYARVGRQTTPMVPVNLNEVCQHVIEDLKPLIDDAGAIVVVTPLPTLMSIETQIGQVLQNLIGNAIVFRSQERPCRVTVSAERDGDAWRMVIEDNGIGIDMKFHDRVFEIFQRLHERGTYDGTGIGLAVVKRIVERHGGRVGFHSIPGQGTRFWFTLPASDPS